MMRGDFPLQPQMSRNLHDELADVLETLDTESNTYTVKTRGASGYVHQPGGRILYDIPRVVETPAISSKLPAGTVVLIRYSLGFPYIAGTLPLPSMELPAAGLAPLDTGSLGVPSNYESPSGSPIAQTNERNAKYTNPLMPPDLVDGEVVFATRDGNRMGVCLGNYNVMEGAPGHKFETFKDLVKLTALKKYLAETGFGTLEIENNGGRCSLKFRGAADHISQSGGYNERWTFRLDIGDAGDYFNMEVTSPDGKTKSKYHISIDGHVTQIATGGLDIVSAGTRPVKQEFSADLVQKIGGSIRKIVANSITEVFSADRKTTLSGSDTRIAYNDNVMLNNNQILSAGGSQKNTICGGSAILATPANIAVETHVLNGSYHLELGNPLKGANPVAMAGFTLAVNNGAITLGQNPDPLALPAMRAEVSLNTRMPNSIALGGTVSPLSNNPALQHAVIFEPLMLLFQALFLAFDIHTHVSPMGIPAAPMSATLSTLLPTFMSTRVLMGG